MTEEKRKPTPEEKAKAAAEARAKAEALRKLKEKEAQGTEAATATAEQPSTEAEKPAAAMTDEEKAKAKAAAAAAAAAKAKAAREAGGDSSEADDADAKAKAAAAAKAKAAAAAAAAAKAKAAREAGGDSSEADDADAKAKAAAAAKAKAAAAAAAAAKAKAAGGGEAAGEAEAPKAPSKNQPYLDKYVRRITEKFGADVLEASYINELAKDMPTLVVKNEKWHDVAQFLKEDEQLAFDYLSNLHGVDYEDRMEVCYFLYSYKNRQSVAVKVKTDREQPTVSSVMDIWRGADWNERETFDLFGIHFPGHTNLSRILLPDEWVGYPMRKDYVQYDEEV
jgi:NADH-quinone oxidoreductase subunit C